MASFNGAYNNGKSRGANPERAAVSGYLCSPQTVSRPLRSTLMESSECGGLVSSRPIDTGPLKGLKISDGWCIPPISLDTRTRYLSSLTHTTCPRCVSVTPQASRHDRLLLYAFSTNISSTWSQPRRVLDNHRFWLRFEHRLRPRLQ